MSIARYSPVANVHLMIELCEANLLSGYILLLAHHVMQFPKEHRKLIELLRTKMPSSSLCIILDNSLIELGAAVDIELMTNAAIICQPSFIVLPDALLDKDASIKLYLEAYNSWKPLLNINGNSSKYLAVIQGAGFIEMSQCCHTYYAHSLSNGGLLGALGIPRKYTNIYGSRYEITQIMQERYDLPIHLMGFSDNLVDDLQSAAIPGVMGIDSATPLRMGHEHIMISLLQGVKQDSHLTVPREEFFTSVHNVSPMMIYNLAYINGVLNASR